MKFNSSQIFEAYPSISLVNKHDHPGVGGDVALHLLELLLCLLDGVVGLGELVIGLIEANLQLLHFLTVVTDVTDRLDMNRTFGQKRSRIEICG